MRYICQGCGRDLTPNPNDYDECGYNEIVNGYTSHTVTTQDHDGFYHSECGPVVAFTDDEYIEVFGSTPQKEASEND